MPFDIKRVYWLYEVPENGSRGGHAHRRLQQLLVAVSGACHVTLDNGYERKTILLNNPYQGLFIDKTLWVTLDQFSPGTVCLVLASEGYNAADYIEDYNEFLKYVKCSK